MAIRQAIQIGHPALKAKNKKIIDFSDPKLKQVLEHYIKLVKNDPQHMKACKITVKKLETDL